MIYCQKSNYMNRKYIYIYNTTIIKYSLFVHYVCNITLRNILIYFITLKTVMLQLFVIPMNNG